MRHQRRLADKVQEGPVDLGVSEFRLAPQEVGRKAVNLFGLRGHVPLGVDIDMETAPRRDEVFNFQGGEFHQPVSQMGLEAGGFCVEDDLAGHAVSWRVSGGRAM